MAPDSGGVVRELFRLVLALVGAMFLVTALGVSLLFIGVSDPNRIARKALVPFFLVVAVVLFRIPAAEVPRTFGIRPVRGAGRLMARGLGAGVLSLGLMNAALFAWGARAIDHASMTPSLIVMAALFLLQAFVLAILEEGVFRGFIHRRLENAGGVPSALLLGPLVFSVSHFLKPINSGTSAPPWRAGIDCLLGLTDIPFRWKESVGLFFVGLVLTVMRHRTGRIWLGVGVHAGWVFLRHLADKSLLEIKPVVREDLFVIGTMRHYDGLAGWIALVLTLAIVARRPKVMVP